MGVSNNRHHPLSVYQCQALHLQVPDTELHIGNIFTAYDESNLRKEGSILAPGLRCRPLWWGRDGIGNGRRMVILYLQSGSTEMLAYPVSTFKSLFTPQGRTRGRLPMYSLQEHVAWVSALMWAFPTFSHLLFSQAMRRKITRDAHAQTNAWRIGLYIVMIQASLTF